MKISKDKGKAAEELLQMLTVWQEQAAKLTTEEISREEYDQWRYNYPKFDTTQQWANVPSKELSDALVKTFKDKLKTVKVKSFAPRQIQRRLFAALVTLSRKVF